jgi:hypothetical protein
MYAMITLSYEGGAMVLIPARCLYCQSDHVTKRGKTEPQCQRGPGHRTGVTDQHPHGNERTEKNGAALESVYTSFLRTLEPTDVEVGISRVDDAAVDDMWSCVGKKQDQRWHAIDHGSGRVFASVFGRRKDDVFLQWKAL